MSFNRPPRCIHHLDDKSRQRANVIDLRNIRISSAFAWGSFLVVPLAAHIANVYRQWGLAAALLALVFAMAFVEAIKGARAWFKGRMDE